MERRHNIDEEELRTLRARLEEAEETLRAIRSGSVDALVVQGANGYQIYTLKGAEEPYRLLVERMQEGALTLTAEGDVVYSNRRFAEMVKLPLERVVGRSLVTFVAAEQASVVTRLVAAAADGGGRREFLFTRSDGSVFPALVSLSALPVGEAAALTVVVTDLTEQKRSEGIAAAERFARSILEQATDAVVVCDTAGRITHASRAAENLSAGPAVGLPFAQAFPLEPELARPAGDGMATPIEAWIDVVLAGASIHGAEVRSRDDAWDERHFLLSAGPLRDGRDEPIGCIVTLTDITERKRTEERQRLLLAELNHRVKNNLAIVRSIASLTRLSSSSLRMFEEAFTGRLKALSLAHNILTLSNWEQGDLRQLVVQSVAPYRGQGREDCISLSGGTVSLPSPLVPPLAMIFHELATNAAKYGALSVHAGRVCIAWELEEGPDGPRVRLFWTEHGGPPVAVPAPERRGFGSRLITRSASHDLGGEAELDYRPEGVCCRIVFPLRAQRTPALTVTGLGAERFAAPSCDPAR